MPKNKLAPAGVGKPNMKSTATQTGQPGPLTLSAGNTCFVCGAAISSGYACADCN